MVYQNNPEYLLLSPIEQRYVSSCYPLDDRPFIYQARIWKEHFRQTSRNPEYDRIPTRALQYAFPHLARLHLMGFFQDTTVQDYFEGIGEGSHTMRLYQFAKRFSRGSWVPEAADALRSVLSHVECCSVRVAEVETEQVHSYADVSQQHLDFGYFNLRSQSPYVFVHGKNPAGVTVVRGATEDEFKSREAWFAQRRESKENPFMIFRKRSHEPDQTI